MKEKQQLLSNNQRLDWLDALRGIAAFFVVFWHTICRVQDYDLQVGASRPLFIFAYFAGLAVPLFFSISGFSIFLTLHKDLIEKNPPKNMTRYYFSFLVRRFFRIAPAYYVALLIFAPFLLMVRIDHIPNLAIGSLIIKNTPIRTFLMPSSCMVF